MRNSYEEPVPSSGVVDHADGTRSLREPHATTVTYSEPTADPHRVPHDPSAPVEQSPDIDIVVEVESDDPDRWLDQLDEKIRQNAEQSIPIVTHAIQGVDCSLCEDNEPHEHGPLDESVLGGNAPSFGHHIEPIAPIEHTGAETGDASKR